MKHIHVALLLLVCAGLSACAHRPVIVDSPQGSSAKEIIESVPAQAKSSFAYHQSRSETGEIIRRPLMPTLVTSDYPLSLKRRIIVVTNAEEYRREEIKRFLRGESPNLPETMGPIVLSNF